MVRQYIGARYVPKFYENSSGTAEWRSGVIYEPLTIVTYNGNSYTSKKAVPAEIGDPSSNPAYWAATGVYNEQVETLRQEVETVKNEIDDINASTLHPKTVIVTDSYGSSAFAGIRNYCEVFRSIGGYTIGENFDYSHLDGAGFVSNGRLYTTPLTDLYNRLGGDMAPEKIERVIIAGGCNDARITVSNILTGMHDTISQAKTYFPNAKIYVACIGGLKNERQNLYRNAVTAYARCAAYGARFLPNVEFVMMNDAFFQADGIHPNQSGMNAIGTALLDALDKGYTDIPLRETGSITLDSAWTAGTASFTVEAYNNDIDFMVKTGSPLACESRTVSGNLVIGTLENNLLTGDQDLVFPVFALVGATGGNRAYNTYGIILNKVLYVVIPTAIEGFTNFIIYRSWSSLIRGLC